MQDGEFDCIIWVPDHFLFIYEYAHVLLLLLWLKPGAVARLDAGPADMRTVDASVSVGPSLCPDEWSVSVAGTECWFS